MKVLFLIKSPKHPSARIRILEQLPYLKNAGFECRAEVIPRNPFLRHLLFKSAKNYSVVVLQKQLISKRDLLFLRNHSKKLIYDFDDAIYMKHAFSAEEAKKNQNYKNINKFKDIIQTVDFIVAANQILAKFAENINNSKPITIIHSSVDPKQIIKCDYSLSSPPIIGWIGTKCNLKHIQYIAPALIKIAEQQNFILRIISDNKIKIQGIDIQYRKWNLKTQYNEIKTFDIGIMPLQPNPYSDGKSAYKLIQYMNIAVPSVASTIGFNKEIGKNEKCCLLADDIHAFAEKTLLLIKNIELRKKLGENGKKLVDTQFTIQNSADAWCEILANI